MHTSFTAVLVVDKDSLKVTRNYLFPHRELVKGKVNVVKRSFNPSAAVLRVLNLDDIVS